MPIQIPPPTIKEFRLSEELAKKYGDDPDNPTIIRVRQATHRENGLRDARLSTYKRRIENDNIVIESDFNLPELVDYEIYLTLAACNIKDGNGNFIFSFKDDRVVHSFEKFRERLGILPSDIVAFIHQCVLETNPQWRPGDEGKKSSPSS